jgi:TonB family protein
MAGWVGNRLQIGPTENHVYYGLDSSRNLLMSDGRSYPQCNGPCDEVATAQAPPPHRIHVKEDVEKAKLIHTVSPMYPLLSEKRGVGTVVLHVVVGKNGTVNSARYVSGPTNLMNSAVKAVLQWRYKPTLVNGVAVEVDTTVSVVFPPPVKQEPPTVNK